MVTSFILFKVRCFIFRNIYLLNTKLQLLKYKFPLLLKGEFLLLMLVVSATFEGGIQLCTSNLVADLYIGIVATTV